jgi:hypothetical protein
VFLVSRCSVNTSDSFVPFGTPTVIADPARDAFFIVDQRFGLFTDDNGVGILRTTAANLLSSTACPSGTETDGSSSCWTTGAVTNITELNTTLDSPHMAVDPRTSGTGAGDVYAVVAQRIGSTTVGTPQLLTAGVGDVQATSPISVQDQPPGFSDRLGLAAAGTGTVGQSHAYVAFTWNSVFGTYGGVPSADVNNHLTLFSY